mgnify:CR=1 FL=1
MKVRYFTIEKSYDSQSWDAITIIPGAGNSNTQIEYSYTDNSFSDKTVYYRIKQTDYDGKYVYFDIMTITHEQNNLQNLISEFSCNNSCVNLVLNLPSEIPASIVINDIQGRILFNKKISGLGLTNISINLSQIKTDVLIINLTHDNLSQVLKVKNIN